MLLAPTFITSAHTPNERAQGELKQPLVGAWLLALTGCRLGEIVKLKWTEVDRAGGCFRLLGHSANTITSRYVHHLDAVLVAAADKVAGEIGRIMRGEEQIAKAAPSGDELDLAA